MRLHFGQIADVTDVVALAILVDVLPNHPFAGHFFRDSERLKNRTTVAPTAAKVIDLAAARRFNEALDEAHDISGMNVIADLLTLVPVNRVFAPLHIALDEIAEEPVQLDA
jgi:hypothetical protein